MAATFALNQRIRPAAGVAAWHLLLAWALIAGLGLEVVPGTERRLTVFDVPQAPPPPPAEQPAERDSADEGAAAPANLRARASPVTAPRTERRIVPPTLPAAPAPGTGNDSDSGAADRPGPGTGAGGEGSGTGAGASGSGTGSGGIAVPARWARGRIDNGDYPREAWRERAGGTVVVRFTVGTDGRPRDCRITRSSGRSDLDSTTCRLIERRFRYAPARDREGRAVEDVAGWQQRWWLER